MSIFQFKDHRSYPRLVSQLGQYPMTQTPNRVPARWELWRPLLVRLKTSGSLPYGHDRYTLQVGCKLNCHVPATNKTKEDRTTSCDNFCLASHAPSCHRSMWLLLLALGSNRPWKPQIKGGDQGRCMDACTMSVGAIVGWPTSWGVGRPPMAGGPPFLACGSSPRPWRVSVLLLLVTSVECDVDP